MKPISELSLEAAAHIDSVFCDIDDTLTTDGRLPAVAYDSLWRLYDAGFNVVPVTGRPAGWCDMIARFWPVAGVIGENGAFYFRYDREKRRLEQRFTLDAAERADLQHRLQAIRQRILTEVPGSAIASDQPYRIHDLAIDFCEDVPRLPEAAIDRIVDIFRAEGATAKVSSIHVNGWFGTYTKLEMIRTFAHEVLQFSLTKDAAEQQRCCYVGDSPNDESAFYFFENSIGVANVADLITRFQCPPAFVTPSRGGRGFAEVAETLLKARTRTKF